jgi:flagellar hook-basal body complex protein FliE
MAIPGISGVGLDAIQLYRSLPQIAGTPAGSPAAAPADVSPSSFGDLIASKLQGAIDLQNQGSQAAQALATGTATDVSAATVAVEKAAIALQLTAAFRNKAIDAYQDVMRMQI